MEEEKYIKSAIEQAKKSAKRGGFPAGAILVRNNKIISKGLSLGKIRKDPTGHAEISAIRKACKKLRSTNLSGTILYTSLEPCFMCLCAAKWAGVRKIVFATRKTREMTIKGYYESSMDIHQINKECALDVNLIYITNFEKEVLNLIKLWEK
ncbi:nucleoside deaminase [bacterium]|nr:MAG: nucleoside deaminase [bacterium]